MNIFGTGVHYHQPQNLKLSSHIINLTRWALILMKIPSDYIRCNLHCQQNRKLEKCQYPKYNMILNPVNSYTQAPWWHSTHIKGASLSNSLVLQIQTTAACHYSYHHAPKPDSISNHYGLPFLLLFCCCFLFYLCTLRGILKHNIHQYYMFWQSCDIMFGYCSVTRVLLIISQVCLFLITHHSSGTSKIVEMPIFKTLTAAQQLHTSLRTVYQLKTSV